MNAKPRLLICLIGEQRVEFPIPAHILERTKARRGRWKKIDLDRQLRIIREAARLGMAGLADGLRSKAMLAASWVWCHCNETAPAGEQDDILLVEHNGGRSIELLPLWAAFPLQA